MNPKVWPKLAAGSVCRAAGTASAIDWGKKELGYALLVQFVAALKQLSVQNLANLTPRPLTVALHYSHPPLRRRIAAFRAGREPRGSAGVSHGGQRRQGNL